MEIKNNFDKYVYIEIGVDSLFSAIRFYSEHRDKQWTFELFEPSRNCFFKTRFKQDRKYLKKRGVRVNLHKVGAYSSNKTMILYHGKMHRKGSSTLFLGKADHKVEYNKSTEVKCIDFDEWVKNNLSKKDYIHMRMNCEGAEYEILPKMIEGGSIDYINSVDLHFHYFKFDEENRKIFDSRHQYLKKYFRERDFDAKMFNGLDSL